LDRKKDAVTDAAGVQERFGVAPASIPDYLALVGDSADGIPPEQAKILIVSKLMYSGKLQIPS
ncbi:MAG: hypothetical protein SW833_19100, partial [Cyanobacteriota bacterium]|nr:hypothetical protein [Cyanobacteriota bacterium]